MYFSLSLSLPRTWQKKDKLTTVSRDQSLILLSQMNFNLVNNFVVSAE